MRLAAMLQGLGLLLCGCLGPVLSLPAAHEPRGVHAWLCAHRACPDEAAKLGGTVRGTSYARGACGCQLEDARHLPQYVEVPPHPVRVR